MTHLTQMLSLANAAKQGAYAPYSQFLVGCSLKSASGQYYTGCNIENASYGLTICAEATAISQMINSGEKIISEILIVSSGEKLCAPCGACRQRLYEFATEETLVYLADHQGIQKSILLTDLLPLAFGPLNLNPTTKES